MIVLHSEEMSCQWEVLLQLYGFNVGDLGLLKSFIVCDEVTPVNVEDGAETVLVKALKKKFVTVVGDSGL